MKKQVIATSLVLLTIVSLGVAGIAVAETQNATTTQATTSSTTSSSTTTATSDASSCLCKDRPALGGSVFNGKHGGGRDIASGCTTTSSRHQVKSWYEQLPQDQKTALQDDLQQARESWYQQLPQDQKDKLTTTLDQLSQDARSRIKEEFGIQ